MKPSHPPRLAVALLHRLVPDNDPLVGDLLEEFESRRRSALWFWRQALVAVALAPAYRFRERRPLRLGLTESTHVPTTSRQLPSRVNLTASPVAWVGGLGLLALCVLMAVMTPWVVWVLLFLLTAGVLSGVVVVFFSRRRVLAGSRGDRTAVLTDHDGPTRVR